MAENKIMSLRKHEATARLLEDLRATEMSEGVTVTRLVLNQDGSALQTCLMLPGNREFRLVEAANRSVIREAMIPLAGKYCRKVERYTDYMVVVSVGDSGRFGELSQGFFKVGGRFVVKVGEGFVDLNGGGRVEGVVDESGKLVDGVLWYGSEECTQSVTAGQMKRKEIAFRCVNLSGVDTLGIVDSVNYGLPRKLSVKKTAAKVDEISKLSTRLSQHCAPSFELTKVETFALYCGKFESLGYEYRDGAAFISNRYLEGAVNSWAERNGRRTRVAEGSLLGLGVQCRPWLCKTFGVCEADSFINGYAERMSGVGVEDAEVIFRESVTEDDQLEFEKLFGSNKEQSRFWGKLLIITDEEATGEIDVLTDLNGLKESFSLDINSGLNVLAWGHLTETARISTQIAASLRTDYSAMKALIREINKEVLDKSEEEILEGEARHASPEDFFVDNNDELAVRVGKILGKVAPGWVRDSDKVLYRQNVEGAVKSARNRSCNLTHEVEGCYGKIEPDVAADYGVNLLDCGKEVEILCKFGGKVGRSVGIMKRHPGPARSEFSKVRFLSMKEYEDRAFENMSFDAARECVERAKRQMDAGLILIPAVKGLLNKHGGADFDGDGVSIITEPRVVELASKEVDFAIVIE